jgi:hypothetical protein
MNVLRISSGLALAVCCLACGGASAGSLADRCLVNTAAARGSEAERRQLCEDACAEGHGESCHVLAATYVEGRSERDEAIRLYRQACRLGHDPACPQQRRLERQRDGIAPPGATERAICRAYGHVATDSGVVFSFAQCASADQGRVASPPAFVEWAERAGAAIARGGCLDREEVVRLDWSPRAGTVERSAAETEGAVTDSRDCLRAALREVESLPAGERCAALLHVAPPITLPARDALLTGC